MAYKKDYDLKGNRYGRWTVVENGVNRVNKGNYSKYYIKCRCDCGEYGEVEVQSLFGGRSKSCGCLLKKYYSTLENSMDDFMSGFDKNGDGCWEWTKYTGSSGYGVIYIKGKKYNAHRLSYEFHNNITIPEGKYVLHKCDNRKCVNPGHLFIGSKCDNYQDSKNKDRHTRGERQANSKLTDEIVRDLRSRYSGKRGEIAAMARELGMSVTNIMDVVRMKTWRHLV